jgi:hypothetical protein
VGAGIAAAGAGRAGVQVCGRARLAGVRGEPNDDRLGSPLAARAPSDAGSTLRAGHLLALPVDGERLGGVPAGPGLRRGIGEQRAE